ncbi:MAG TPA: hypothetical protein VGD59_01390 [Acidisarcina sp.]
MLRRKNEIAHMKSDITNKLTKELGQEIVSERQVVYILVELRKLLETQGLDKDTRYRALMFSCDWAAHSKLNRESAKAITLLFDRYETRYRHEPVGVSQAGIPELVEFCEHTRFRQQFVVACEQSDIPTDAIKDDDWWRSFLRHFSEVVRDCPIEAKPETTTYVTRVTASAIDPTSIGIFNRQFAICWMWECRDREHPNTVSSLF